MLIGARAGRALAAARLAPVLALTALLTGGAAWGPRPQLPLLDGEAAPAPYRWVNPPPRQAAGNQPPTSARVTLPLRAAGTALGAHRTGDGQAVVFLDRGAIPRRDGAARVELAIDPADPATLAPPPPGLVIVGNAYRVHARYAGGPPVTAVQGRSSIALRYPLLGTNPPRHPQHPRLLTSPDGRAWKALPSAHILATHQVTGPFTAPGWFAVASPAPPAPAARAPVLLTAAALALVLAAAALRRRAAARGGARR